MLYEVFPSMTAQVSSPNDEAPRGYDESEWLPHTLKNKLNKAERLFLEQQRRLMVQQTREQVGHDLHDNTLQTLTALSYQLSLLQLGDQVTKQDLQLLHQEVKVALTQLRSDIHGLRSPDDDKLSIKTSVKRYIAKLEQERPLPMIEQTFDQAAEALPAPVRHCVAKALKVGLGHAVKHAQTRHVWLKLFFQNEKLIAKVMNDGKGLPKSKLQMLVRQPQSGLGNLADMVAPLRGRVFVRSRNGEGSVFTTIIPLEAIHG